MWKEFKEWLNWVLCLIAVAFFISTILVAGLVVYFLSDLLVTRESVYKDRKLV